MCEEGGSADCRFWPWAERRRWATPSYTAVFLPTNGMTGTYAEAIASNGEIVGYSSGATADALVWSNPYAAPVDLRQFGNGNAIAFATDGSRQVGKENIASGDNAVLWNGTADSVVNLNPPGFFSSWAREIGQGQEVGFGTPSIGGGLPALLWTGTADSTVNLIPPGYASSNANATNGIYQAGAATPNPVNGVPQESRAIVWSGTAASAVDITPAGYADAYASGISGNLVAGGGSPETGKQDALLWNINNGTYTDLQPTNLSGFFQSGAYAVAGQYYAGYGYTNSGAYHAMVWSGSAGSAVDLNGFLPAGDSSIAYGVDAQGDVVGIAGSYGQYQSVIWLVPEPMLPSGVALLIYLR